MENYSLSDIAAVSENGGFGGGNAWILIILFALIFGWGGNGFGGNANESNNIMDGQRFDALSRQINQIGDGISSLGYSQLQQMDSNTASINGNIVNEGRAIQTQLCAINSNIDNKFAQLEKSQLEQIIANQQNQINQLSMAQQMTGVVRYPMSSSWAMNGNPFCGCGCTNI